MARLPKTFLGSARNKKAYIPNVRIAPVLCCRMRAVSSLLLLKIFC
jgi:hypothetical protein